MRILIEEYQYNVANIKDILYGIDALENVEGKVSRSLCRVFLQYSTEGLCLHPPQGIAQRC